LPNMYFGKNIWKGVILKVCKLTIQLPKLKLYFAMCLVMIFMLNGCSGLTLKSIQDGIAGNENGGGLNLLPFFQRPIKTCPIASNTCALDALHIVLKHWGANVTKSKLAQILPDIGQRGYSLDDLKNASKHLGYEAFSISSSVEELAYHTQRGRPCVIFYEAMHGFNHASVIWGVQEATSPDKNTKQIYIQDTDRLLPKWVDGESILSRWDALGRPMLLIARASELPNK